MVGIPELHSFSMITNGDCTRRKSWRLAAISLAVASISIVGAHNAGAQLYKTSAKFAYLYDSHTGTVLFEKNADDPMRPASMAKVMTTAVVFNAIKEKRLTLDDEFLITEHAWRTGGAPSGTSTMFAAINSTIRIEDLLKGVIVHSGNDACIALAEGMAGSEDAFATLMNEYAAKLGHTSSRYTNPTGLPDPAMTVTARELAMLADHLIRTYPALYAYYKEAEFTWNKIRQKNRNPLLGAGLGVDGLKTGYTKESGYGIVLSAMREGQRLVMVLGGMKSKKERATEARKLLGWGFRTFELLSLFDEDEPVGEARVYGGESSRVPLVGEGAIKLLVPRGSRDRLKARIIYQGPVEAPIEKGQPIGKLKIWRGEYLTQVTPLFAATDIDRGGIHGRAFDGLTELLTGWW